MANKKINTTKKKEDLPSFLLPTPDISEKTNFFSKTTKNVHHLGPIFFGCHEYQPIFHNLNLGPTLAIHSTASSTENILRDAFLPKPRIEKRLEVKKTVYTGFKARVVFPDPYPHKCPGTRKVCAPEAPSTMDLGKSVSIIEGETSKEILAYCVRHTSNESLSDVEYEVLALSDLWEKRRIFMSDKQRMAHPHFPKQFVTVRINGPTIPASITITKLPSRRKTSSELGLDMKFKTKAKKTEKESDVKTEKQTEDMDTEEENSSISKEFSSTEENTLKTSKSEIQDVQEDKTNEESVHEDSQSDSNIMQEDEKFNENEEEIETKEDAEKEEETETKEEEEENMILTENVEEEEEEISAQKESED